MRGRTDRQAEMLLGVDVEEFIPANHPIRRIRRLTDQVLADLSPRFSAMYSTIGRPSVPPEHLIKGTLLMALCSIRSERQFCERLRYDLLFKWFLGLTITEAVFDATSFTKNRERLLGQEIAMAVLGEVIRAARRRRLVSEDHFTVDGTLLQAWASLKSVRPCDEQEPPAGGAGGRNPDVSFRGQRRSNQTHVSTTDPEAKLARKGNGQETKLCYVGHILWRIATVSSSMCSSRRRTGELNGRPHSFSLTADRHRASASPSLATGLRHQGLRGVTAPARGHAAHRPEHVESP